MPAPLPVHSDKLSCGGRACAICGNCRDWFWRPNDNIKNPKTFTKRNNAKCTGVHHVYYVKSGHYVGYGDDINICECEDNRS